MEEARDGNENILGGDGDQPNPFMQAPVLEVLFAKLSPEDLPRCRLVCKMWRDESLSFWRTSATVRFERERIVNEGAALQCTTSLRQFMNFWENECAEKPFKQFHISGWHFKVGDADQTRFLALVGEHATNLTLNRCSFDGENLVQKILYQTFPNLQFLTLENGPFKRRREYSALPMDITPVYKKPTFGVHPLKSLRLLNESRPDSIMEMLSHFHMLNSLRIVPIEQREIRELMNTINVIRAQDPKKLPIKHLDYGHTWTRRH